MNGVATHVVAQQNATGVHDHNVDAALSDKPTYDTTASGSSKHTDDASSRNHNAGGEPSPVSNHNSYDSTSSRSRGTNILRKHVHSGNVTSQSPPPLPRHDSE